MFISDINSLYSSIVGIYPSVAEIAASSADARNTFAPSPSLLGKFLVEVDTTVDSASTRAWFPMHKEHPGISSLTPAFSKIS